MIEHTCGTSGWDGQTKGAQGACEACHALKAEAFEQRKMLNAKLVEYEGPFFIGRNFYADIDEYIWGLRCKGKKPQEFAYVPGRTDFKLNVSDMWSEHMYPLRLSLSDDVELDGQEEFQAAINEFQIAVDKFTEANANSAHYWYDERRKFKLPTEYILEKLVRFVSDKGEHKPDTDK